MHKEDVTRVEIDALLDPRVKLFRRILKATEIGKRWLNLDVFSDGTDEPAKQNQQTRVTRPVSEQSQAQGWLHGSSAALNRNCVCSHA